MKGWRSCIPQTSPTSWKSLRRMSARPSSRLLMKKRPLRPLKRSIVESLDSERAADIVEEMNPDAAADLLADLPEERTEQILIQMEPEAQQEVVELLEHKEGTAAGRMTTEFLALPVKATVQNAIDSLREFEGGVEAISTIYLVDSQGTLVAA